MTAQTDWNIQFVGKHATITATVVRLTGEKVDRNELIADAVDDVLAHYGIDVLNDGFDHQIIVTGVDQ